MPTQSSFTPGIATSGDIGRSLRSRLESGTPDSIGPAEGNKSAPSLGPEATLSDQMQKHELNDCVRVNQHGVFSAADFHRKITHWTAGTILGSSLPVIKSVSGGERGSLDAQNQRRC